LNTRVGVERSNDGVSDTLQLSRTPPPCKARIVTDPWRVEYNWY